MKQFNFVPECTQELYSILDGFKDDLERDRWESHEDFLSQLCKFLLDVDKIYYAECIKFNNKKGNEDETT